MKSEGEYNNNTTDKNIMFNLKYNTKTAAVVAAVKFEEEFLEIKEIRDLRSPVTFDYKTNSSLKAAAKKQYDLIKSCCARLKDDERAAEIAAQIANRESGWQNSYEERRDTQLKFSFIKENKDGTYSVYIKGYPVREVVAFKMIGYIDLNDNTRHNFVGNEAHEFKVANYLPSKIEHPYEDVPFININIGNLEL